MKTIKSDLCPLKKIKDLKISVSWNPLFLKGKIGFAPILTLIMIFGCEPGASQNSDPKVDHFSTHNSIHNPSSQPPQKSSLAFKDSQTYAEIMNADRRFQKWVDLIQIKRVSRQLPKLDLTSTSARSPYSPENPDFLNLNKIESQWDLYQLEIPKALQLMVFSDQPLTSEIPSEVTSEDLGRWYRKLKKLRSWSFLWTDVEDNPSWYLEKSTADIRPYLYFSRLPDRKKTLSELKIDDLNDDSKSDNPLVKALLGLCRHGNYSISNCFTLLKEHVRDQNTEGYFNQFWYLAEYWSKAPFVIEPGRKNPLIVAHTQKKQIEFKVFDVKSSKVREFIKTNVEDEFKGQDWSSVVTFTKNLKEAVVQVQFSANKNPSHGNSIIQMAADEDLDSELARWTIRHEFGHVLGFKDCYLRFLDAFDPETLLYYEMDLSHLMCTMYGKMTPQMADEIKNVYLK